MISSYIVLTALAARRLWRAVTGNGSGSKWLDNDA